MLVGKCEYTQIRVVFCPDSVDPVAIFVGKFAISNFWPEEGRETVGDQEIHLLLVGRLGRAGLEGGEGG